MGGAYISIVGVPNAQVAGYSDGENENQRGEPRHAGDTLVAIQRGGGMPIRITIQWGGTYISVVGVPNSQVAGYSLLKKIDTKGGECLI